MTLYSVGGVTGQIPTKENPPQKNGVQQISY